VEGDEEGNGHMWETSRPRGWNSYHGVWGWLYLASLPALLITAHFPLQLRPILPLPYQTVKKDWRRT
jgi:hypothetical protein